MWFWFSLIALICWSGSDLFSKIGCQDADDKYSHLKMVMAVGLVMGLHAAYEIFINGTEINGSIILTYLPVSLLYISSMTIGYIGLRYIELSISSPICNSSGALVAVLALATGGLGELVPAATALVCVGVIGLGIVEAREDDDLRAARQQASNHRYAKSALALILPVIYCLLDALGTFADSRVLETLNEDSANCAYELTFLLAGIVCFVYVVLIKKSRLVPKREGPKYAGGGPVRVHLRAGGHGTRGPGRTHHLRLLRGLSAVEPHFPEGKAQLEALRHDRTGGGGYCDTGHLRCITTRYPPPGPAGDFFVSRKPLAQRVVFGIQKGTAFAVPFVGS